MNKIAIPLLTLILIASASFGQNKQSVADGIVKGANTLVKAVHAQTQLQIEAENAAAQRELMSAQAGLARIQTEQIRLQVQLQVEDMKRQANQLPQPAMALSQDPDFNKLPLEVRIRFARLVQPDLREYSDPDIATLLIGMPPAAK